ncbi:hypothetical protein Arth_1717 [Arthrobacter sp. FB24]|nr:hypothetical protein Arth_1717 [Arthrobacter sp. FB24]
MGLTRSRHIPSAALVWISDRWSMSVSCVRPSNRGLRLGAGMIGILLIAVNLRVGFVTVGPLLEGITRRFSPCFRGFLKHRL